MPILMHLLPNDSEAEGTPTHVPASQRIMCIIEGRLLRAEEPTEYPHSAGSNLGTSIKMIIFMFHSHSR